MGDNEAVSMHATEILYDPRSPRFGAGQKDGGLGPGLWIDWALEDTGLCKGDRLVEVNGKLVLTKSSREDLSRLLQAAPDPALLVVLRQGGGGCAVTSSSNSHHRQVATLRCELEAVKERAEEAQRAKDGLRSDNIRLTHRISYLEEQVSELMTRKNAMEAPPSKEIRNQTQSPIITSTVKTSKNVTNINISSQQLQQQAAANSSNNQHKSTRSKSSLSNISNTHIPAPTISNNSPSMQQSNFRRDAKARNAPIMQHSTSVHNLDQIYNKHHHHHHHHQSDMAAYPHKTQTIMDQSYRKATKIVQELTNCGNKSQQNRSKSSIVDKQLLNHYNGRKSTSVLDFRSEVCLGPKYDSKSVENLDMPPITITQPALLLNKRLYKKFNQQSAAVAAEMYKGGSNNNKLDYASEPDQAHRIKTRPMPPKKPLRLSLHRAQSLQSVDATVEDVLDSRKPMKRNYKGEPPIAAITALDASKDNINQQKAIKWTTFAQKKDNFILFNENLRGNWC